MYINQKEALIVTYFKWIGWYNSIIYIDSLDMTTPNSYLDDFMDKMITVPNDINRFLRLIRKLDKKAEEIQASLVPLQTKFLAQLKELKDKKINEMPPAMKADLDLINKKQKDLYGYSKEKKEIADQLSH